MNETKHLILKHKHKSVIFCTGQFASKCALNVSPTMYLFILLRRLNFIKIKEEYNQGYKKINFSKDYRLHFVLQALPSPILCY